MNRVYEELFIVRPDATEEEVDPLVEQLTNTIASKGGNVDKTDRWGIRKLAYRVKKYNEGNYILLHFSAPPDAALELERRLRVSDLVLKFITVRIDRKMKKVDKRRKAREKRASRRPAPPVAAPAMPTAEAFALPGAAGPTPGAPMPGAPVASPPAPAPAPTTNDERPTTNDERGTPNG
jgi:small subunit ribosomal protein S6